MSNSRKILFMMSGSIAAFKACQAVSLLVQAGHEVQIAVTPSTFNFVGRATLEGLTGKSVAFDLWENGRAMDHIHLARWADVAVLCPATAGTLGKLAHGLSDDLVSTLALAWEKEKPFHIFPAMNREMLRNEATQANLKTLASRGYQIAPTASGSLACGEVGEGRLLEPPEIVKILNAAKVSLGKVLITSGATREPIDGIRFISNVSTGQTGAALCDQLRELGWDVTYLHGTSAQQPQRSGRTLAFTDFADLNSRLHTELSTTDYAAVIHAAAVSDYSVEQVEGSYPDTDVKLKTDRELTLKLKSNFKILPRLKEYSRNKSILVLGFKLTLNADAVQGLAAARSVLGPTVDAVVTNDWSAVNKDRNAHPGSLLKDSAPPEPFTDLNQLAMKFHQLSLKHTQGVPHGPLS